MPSMQIVVRSGSFSDWQAAALLACGAIASDFEVTVFALDEAVWSLRKEVVGKDTALRSHFQDFQTKMAEAIDVGHVEPWWALFRALKELGKLQVLAQEVAEGEAVRGPRGS
jgi:peroxiredoxin family protein